jgi:hypothetical protein
VVRRAQQRSKACSPPFPLEQDKIRENVCVTEGGWRALLSFGSLTSSCLPQDFNVLRGQQASWPQFQMCSALRAVFKI